MKTSNSQPVNQGSNGISCREGITFSSLHRIRCLPQERGPRYVNNVAVFVKKGQKDIDANERPCHAEMSSMDALKTVLYDFTKWASLGERLYNDPKHDPKHVFRLHRLHRLHRPQKLTSPRRCWSVAWCMARAEVLVKKDVRFLSLLGRFHRFLRWLVFTCFHIAVVQVPSSSNIKYLWGKGESQESQGKGRQAKGVLLLCGRKPGSHITHFWYFLVQSLIDPHWSSLILVIQRCREQLLRFWCNPSVPGQLITRSNDVPCHWGGSAVCRSDFFYSDPRGAPRHTTASSPIQRNFGRILLSEVHQGDTVPDAWSKRVTLEGRKIFDEFWCVISWVIRATPCEHYMGITMLCLRKTPQMWIFVESSESKMHCLPVTPLKQHQSH